ncbi:HIT domain-containing protein [Allohahella marinimesophila]|uniref:HIT domain-containing protein n=1 Tax=Allohahella marinimesophila TaxID=1054972 RepID=A0ABP7NPW2_9GAMM
MSAEVVAAEGFELDHRIERDTVLVGRLGICEVRLMNDSAYPWCLLVPMVADATELHELTRIQRCSINDTSCLLATVMMGLFSGEKMNVAALGNVVPQLHIHHIVRFSDDQAWPGPVWGRFPATPYEPEALSLRVADLRAALSLDDTGPIASLTDNAG